MRFLGFQVAFAVLITLVSFGASAEGSFQAGLNQSLRDFANSTYPQKVDILAAGEVINVSLCGDVNADSVSVTILDPSNVPVYSSGTVSSNVDCADPFTAPLTTPIRYTTTTSGVFTIQLQNIPGNNIRRFDITVTTDALTNPDPAANGGRLWAYSWQYDAGTFGQVGSTDANYYALVPGGRLSTNYVWMLDLNNFAGYVYTLVANDVGVDAPYSGYSTPRTGRTVTAKFPQYFSYPVIADPRPTEPPVLTGGLTFIDNAGQDYAISPAATAGVQDSGSFEFTSDVAGTYAITIDTNSNGIYGAGDKLLLGSMVAGLNQVSWDGTDANGIVLAAGQYGANLQARLGEYHFVASDAETSGGTEDGLTMFLANSDGSVVDTTVYWDDATFLAGSSNLPNGALASTPAGKHTWGDFTSTSIGNQTYMDTYVYGLSSTYTALTAIVSDDILQTGIDGLLTIPSQGDSGGNFTITVNDADINVVSSVVETATVVVTNLTTGEQEQVSLTETGVNTGVFSLVFSTVESTVVGVDNDGSLNVMPGNNISVTYFDQLDSAGASVNRVEVIGMVDATAPVITLIGSDPVSIEQGSTYTDAGASASDNLDGDITASIVTNNPVDTNTVGSYTVTYNVADATGNNATQVTRTVNVTADATAPVITLNGSDPVSIEQGSTYTDAGASAQDNLDGDLTANIVTVNPVDTNVVGSYTVTYNVADATGNNATQVTRTVNVTADATAPVITLIGSDPVSIEQGTPYSDAGASASDNIDGDITASIVTNNPVDTNVVGSYTVTYNVTDGAGNNATEVTRTVNVTADATAPVITLIGSDPVSIEQGSTYTDAGASAQDNIDGDITASIVTNNPVDTNTVGSYTVTYNVADATGNNATQVTRTVNVTADATAPVITLIGSDPVSIEQGTPYSDAGASASDNIDGDITASIVTNNPVDTNVVGSYTVTYNVTDATGNPAIEVTRTVNVTADATVPVITLIGSDPVSIEQGSTYTDVGASAQDNLDGDITASIVTNNPVDTNTVGSYTVTYNVADATGNNATQVTRTVNVTADATAPVITLIGSDPVSIEQGSTYTDAGASAQDNIDGDITASIVTNNPVDTNTVGSYTVTYNVADATGNNATQVTRTVNVTADATVPVITLNGSDPVSIEQGTPYSDAGATALDNVDGDLTGSIVTVNPVDTNTVGSYTVTYNVTDGAGNNATEVTRTVNVTADATAPVITLIGSDPVSLEQGTAYTDAGASAQDNLDGDLTGSIVTDNQVDTNTVGSYTVTYNVTDATGNPAIEVTRTVNVTADATAPVITLIGSDPVSIEQGTAYTDAGASALDNLDGDLTASIVTNNPVDTNTVGSYTVTYNVTDGAGNNATEVTRTVNVTADATAPVITLIGSDPVSIEQGSTYTDAGASAQDNIDGDITASIVTNNPVDTNTVGSYTVTYNVADATGNNATQVTRTVNVTADATAPVITLNGSDPVSIEQGSTYTDAGASASDNIDGDLTANIITVNPVDTNVVGSYTVTYNVTDATGNNATQVTRTVNVTADATAPVITLIGSDPVSIEQGSTYTDAGASAQDNTDGDITASIVTNNPVDTNTVGSYTVTYNVTDATGNPAIEVTRTVNVTFDPLLDEDGDGVSNGDEGAADSDGDGVANYLDLDSDNDGIPDVQEGMADSDADGVPDFLDIDSDNDGMFDLTESGIGNPIGLDADNDGRIDSSFGNNGLADAIEVAIDSGEIDYVIADSDGDGIEDFRDLDSDNDGLNDVIESAGLDGDNDGLIGTGVPPVDVDGAYLGAPLSALDSDDDGVANFRDLDSDNDGLFDVVEVDGVDPDGDGVVATAPDVGANGIPDNGNLSTLDTDSDGVADYIDLDSDNDGIPDVVEAGGNDADGDGVIGSGAPTVNSIGVPNGGPLPSNDTDGDGIANYRDLDADNDGGYDLVESGGQDSDNNGLVDGFVDDDGNGFDDGLSGIPLLIVDSDGDGIPDYLDRDDVDGDGISDYLDRDDDNDGIPDVEEGDGIVDTDGDSIPDSRDLDSDNDGIYDLIESGVNNPLLLDSDNNGRIDDNGAADTNGLADDVESSPDSGVVNYNAGMPVDSDGDGVEDFRDLDSDNNGIPDVLENGGSDPDSNGTIGLGAPVATNSSGVATGVVGGVIDSDGDGLADYLDVDADGDAVYDLVESGGLDANNDGMVDNYMDADGNGFDDNLSQTPLPHLDTDGDTVLNYLDQDDDNDGIPDSLEGNGTVDSDGDSVPDSRDLDSDNNGISDLIESGVNNPLLLDSDNNGRIDDNGAADANGLANIVESSPDSGTINYNGGVLVDTDGDGLADYLDVDADNDGIFDLIEVGGTDSNGDGIVDNYIDANGDGYDDNAISSLSIVDLNNNGLPDYLESERNAVKTGLKGVGGCSVAGESTSIDPTLPLLLLFSMLALMGGNIRKVLFGRG